ncbi:fimbrial protein [Atlantibacter sp.]|uniref:fimbrial protein n=1 Tax=Atlantibacter sp. TaxID=1903473 RepID=UPI0028A60777|nr:fimbrial protein [Atlantibacter sp.]
MKKTLLGLATSALFITGSAVAQDHSTTVVINGFVAPAEIVCIVQPSESSVSLVEQPENLINQGDNATAPYVVHLSVDGDPGCATKVEQGKIAYKFSGVADEGDGTALANALTDDTAAKGVAIGVFDSDNKPVSVNTGRLTAKKDTAFGLQMVRLTGHEAVSGNINTFVTIDIERL